MVLKLRTNLKERIPGNLTQHTWSEFTERPTWPYIGASRTDERGNPRNARHFSLAVNQSPGRSFVWTVDDQAWAVREGFFLHRSGLAERVNIIWINRFEHDSDDGYASIAELERRNFHAQSNSPNYYRRALRFIKQQDQFGYSGAWERTVMFYSHRLQWYKDFSVRNTPGAQLSKLGNQRKAQAVKRVDIAKEARKHSFAAHVKRNYILKDH